MAHPSVVDAVETRLRAGFARCPIFFENEGEGPPEDGSAWILVDFPWSRAEWATTDEFEEEGGFRVRLSVVAGSGARLAREWLEEIAVLFRGRRFGSVHCFAPQSPVTSDGNDAGAYFRLELTVPYRATVADAG